MTGSEQLLLVHVFTPKREVHLLLAFNSEVLFTTVIKS